MRFSGLRAVKGPSLYRRPGFWLIYVGLWTLVAILLACQSYLGQNIYPGQVDIPLHLKVPVYSIWGSASGLPTFGDHLRWSLEVWYTRAALSPLALWLALSVRIGKRRTWRMLSFHLLNSVALDAVAVVIIAGLYHWLEPHHPPFYGELKRGISSHIAFNFLVYWVLVALVQAWHYYNDTKLEEVRSAQLREELAQTRLTVLKSQLHPHFLFNALHSIATLLYEDPAMAEDLLLRVSHLLRTFLEDTHAQEVPLRKEVAILDWHLGIECIRFGDRLTTKTEIEEGTLDCAVPHLILQPLVENAILHGIGKHPGADEVKVHVTRVGDSLQMEVTNSNSVLAVTSEEAFRQGIGLSNIQYRLRELYDTQYSMTLTSLLPRGVSVRITVPFRTFRAKNAGSPEYLR